MNKSLRLLLATSAAVMPCVVAAQDSLRLEIVVADKVSAVWWVVDAGACTLQIHFAPVRVRPNEPTPPPPPTETEAWLLTADGGTIPHKPRWPVGGIQKSGDLTYHAIYEFPCSAATELTAVVVRVDDELFVEKLAVPDAP